MTPEQRDWYRAMEELFKVRAGGHSIMLHTDEASKLAAHFGRLALGETVPVERPAGLKEYAGGGLAIEPSVWGQRYGVMVKAKKP